MLAACDRRPPPPSAETATAEAADENTPRIPSFIARLLDGGELDTTSVVGRRPMLLIFWSTWCDPCIAQLPHLVRFHALYRDRVEVVSVAVDDEHELPLLREVVAKHGVTYPVALDLEGHTILPRFSSSTGLPVILVVDAAGRVQFTQRNYKPGDERALADALGLIATGSRTR
jgi:thiol-disulfide isomerase/thioredoxin